MIKVGEGIDMEQEISDEETSPFIDQIDAEHEGDQNHEHQATALGNMAQELVQV